MDTRNKERIVGAIALVAIVVIVVPELLTGQRSPPAAAPAAGGTPVRTVRISLDRDAPTTIPRPAAPVAAASPPAAPPDGGTAADPVEAGAPPAEGTAPRASPLADAPGADAKPSPPEARPSPQPAPAATAQSAPAVTHALGPTAAPASSPAGPPRPSAAAHGGEQWVVQLGSFSSKENAARLAASLKTKGYAAFVSEFRGSKQVLFRVRVGPEQDRARADAIALRLARDGHPGSVAPSG